MPILEYSFPMLPLKSSSAMREGSIFPGSIDGVPYIWIPRLHDAFCYWYMGFNDLCRNGHLTNASAHLPI